VSIHPLSFPLNTQICAFLYAFEKELLNLKSEVYVQAGKNSEEIELDKEQEIDLEPFGIENPQVSDPLRKSGSDLKFHIVWNDGSDESLIDLAALKNIFATQLPKMPKEYIVRLVFDRNHKSLCMKKNGRGICYRPFYSQAFAEIVFCAVTSVEQVKGYGTILMNNMKEYAKAENLRFFLTYADNYAIGYFKKQGFTKSPAMDRDLWFGYIKDYDGGTLMECKIHPLVNYLAVWDTLQMQLQITNLKLKEISHSHEVHPGLTNFQQGASSIDVMSIPGVLEAGYKTSSVSKTTRNSSEAIPAPLRELNANLAQILKELRANKDSWPFLDPVDRKQVPDYFEVIKRPMDLGTMLSKVNSNFYRSKEAFLDDFKLMIENCKIYNSPETTYFRCAAALDLKFPDIWSKVFPESE
jgi:histone acetyltransferase